MSAIKDSHSKHKKSSKPPRTPTPSRSNRNSPAKKGSAPTLQETSPVVISTEQQGEMAASDPRTWLAPELVQPSTEDTEPLDDRITRLVAAALAKALPAALGAPAITQGRTSTSLDAPVYTQGRTFTNLDAPADTQGRTQCDSQDSVTEQAPAAGGPVPSGLAAAVGRPPRPPAGPVNSDRSRQGETERRTVVVGRSLHEYQPSSSASVPQVGHSAPPQTQTRRPTAAVSKPPRMTLPPPPTRLVELDDQMDREQDLIQWSEHESLDDDYDDEEQEPHPFAEVPG